MKEIKIKCATGFELNIDELSIYDSKLKKHSMLEIMRIEDSIEKDGFLFPITVGKIDSKNYIIDGEATYHALCEMSEQGFSIPAIPVVYIKCNKDTIRKLILIGTSTNHCVTEISLKKFVENTNIDLKEYGFPTFDLIDFHTDIDIGLYVDTIGGKFSEQKLNKIDFEGLLI